MWLSPVEHRYIGIFGDLAGSLPRVTHRHSAGSGLLQNSADFISLAKQTGPGGCDIFTDWPPNCIEGVASGVFLWIKSVGARPRLHHVFRSSVVKNHVEIDENKGRSRPDANHDVAVGSPGRSAMFASGQTRKMITAAAFVAIAAMAAIPATVQALPELTVTIGSNNPEIFSSGSSFQLQNASSNGVTVNVSGASNVYTNTSGSDNINTNSVNITNTTGSTQVLAINVQDTGFVATGSPGSHLYSARESFGGEIAAGSAKFVFTTTATPDTSNGSSASVVYSSGTYTAASSPFSVGAQTSANTLLLSTGDEFTIDSNMLIMLSSNASANFDIANDNTISEVVSSGAATPEPASSALAMAGMVPLFFVRRRKS